MLKLTPEESACLESEIRSLVEAEVARQIAELRRSIEALKDRLVRATGSQPG